MHNHNGKKNLSMMWMMLVCCLLPIGLLLFAGGTLSSGGYLWLILIGVFVVVCIWMMFKGHGERKDDGTEDDKADSVGQPKNDEHKHGGCCH